MLIGPIMLQKKEKRKGKCLRKDGKNQKPKNKKQKENFVM